jgi:hypothetical protein
MVKGAGPQPAGHIHDYHRRGKTDHKRTRSIYERSRSRSADSRPHTSGYESDRSQLSEYSRYKREEKDRRDFYKRKEDYKKDKYKRESPYKPKATFDNTAPPSLQEQKDWYNKRGTCLFCGERKHHTKFQNAPQGTNTTETGYQTGRHSKTNQGQMHILWKPEQPPHPNPQQIPTHESRRKG